MLPYIKIIYCNSNGFLCYGMMEFLKHISICFDWKNKASVV
jgi:hypothetical protein